MVPVELRLNNFLSYGTAAPALDFEQFHVACLSGRNGQGKSALLDAITWALWGEARKSSGSHKPDDELIRIGTRRMEVELVFDLEGERYRVVRSYARSATGKTSRAELELHVYEAATGDYRPLTGASMRETQEHLDTLLGLDYDTFINSAFLLQGRSDEFTKKKPSERKDILARILNLGRYERLAEMARDRERLAAERLQQSDAEIGRLTQALAEEPAWKARRTEVEQEIAQQQEHLQAQRKEEQCLMERLAALEARAREALGLRQSLDAAGLRRRQHEQEAEGLRARIAEADTLIAQRAQIEKDYDRSEALRQEREALDEKGHLHRALERQIDQREAELRDRRNDHEKRLHSLDVELKANRSALRECEGELAGEAAARRALEQARRARQQFEEQEGVYARRKELEEQIGAAKRVLLGEREALSGQLAAFQDQLNEARQLASSEAALQAERAALARSHERLRAVQKEIEEVTKEGQLRAGELKEWAGRRSAHDLERDTLQQQLGRLLSVDQSTCPTCGTELTPAHRADVEGQYRSRMRALQRDVEEGERWAEARKKEQEQLRGTYVTLKREAEELQAVPHRLGVLGEQLRQCAEAKEALRRLEGREASLRRQLAEETYGAETRRQLRTLEQALAERPFDERAFERLREEAAQVGRYEDQLRRLEQVSGRKEQLLRSIGQQEEQVDLLRRQLDDGSVFKSIQDQIRQLKTQLGAVGFEAHRLEDVRQALKALGDAGARLKDLLNAQQNQADWKAQLEVVGKRQIQAQQEQQTLAAQLGKAEAELADKPAVEAQQRTLAASRAGTEDCLRHLQIQLGELSARLAQAGRDREALAAQRRVHAEAKADRTLYRHLRTAFGKHGIPSLIIEQTLPEIEERANDLLDRLTEGKMHVRLDTLKDKKTGGTRETLEIIITDEQGVPRPYETFSGGEAFRINFALRIALAQLLAERSGVRIRTLVIDEGFGTQDAQGVQSLVEAIQVVQDDFEKIVVITHLDQLKEAFPVRIEVEKDPVDGSRFEILGV